MKKTEKTTQANKPVLAQLLNKFQFDGKLLTNIARRCLHEVRTRKSKMNSTVKTRLHTPLPMANVLNNDV